MQASKGEETRSRENEYGMSTKRASTPPRRPTTTKPKITSLQTVPRYDLDRYDEQLDEDIRGLRFWQVQASGFETILLAKILRQIGNFDNEILENILEHNESAWGEIQDLLQKSITEKRFHTLRRLEILQPNERAPIHLQPNTETIQRAVAKAWTTNFVGNTHQLLLNNIETMFRDNPRSYGREVAIIQSSGSGKSRMVHELSKLIFTIPLNLGTGAHTKSHVYPMPDSEVGEFFLSFVEENPLRVAVSCFFGHLFDHIRVVLETKLKEPSFQENLAVWWSQHLAGGGREEMYRDVLMKTHRDGGRTAVASKLTANTALRLLVARLSFIIKLPLSEQKVKPRIIFYVDEAHTLIDSGGFRLAKGAEADLIPKNRFDVFRSCATNFQGDEEKLPIFFVYISTLSKLAHIAPQKSMIPSQRGRLNPNPLPAPITETPFDCYFERSNSALVPGTLSHSDVAGVAFLARFGRPLFWTMMGEPASDVKPDLDAIDNLVGLATMKLIASEDDSIKHVTNTGKLAVLDVLLSLAYERKKSVTILESNMVASHMRTAFSVPQHRQYVSSGYPSEPLLAEAASRTLCRWRVEFPDVVLETLTQSFHDGILDVGALGELVGRELLTHAYQSCFTGAISERHFSNGCLLTTFIKKLFTSEHAEKVLKSVPDNVRIGSGKPFLEAFKEARIRFTHYAKVTDHHCVTTHAMWAAYARGMAIICPNNHRAVDCIIPILLWDVHLCEHAMTGLLVQFKRRAAAGSKAKYAIKQEDIGFFGKDKPCEHGMKASMTGRRPYVALIMELGVQPRRLATKPGLLSSKATTAQTSLSHLTTTAPAARSSSRVQTPKGHVHPRYQFFAYGCSSTVYAVIHENQKEKYALLLRSRNILQEHGRQDPASLSMVMKLKPFFSLGTDSFHWVKDPDLNVATDVPEETVEVGAFTDSDDESASKDDEMQM